MIAPPKSTASPSDRSRKAAGPLGVPRAVLDLDSVVVGYGHALLEPISGPLRQGEFLFIMGANGAGKTTLLRTILGLHPSLGGHVAWGVDVVRAFVRQRQQQSTGPERVVDAVRSGLTTRGTWWQPGYVRRHADTVDACIADCGLSHLRSQQVGTLSEGQKQRVMLARALASGATCLILDEPTAAMDAINEAQTFELLTRIQAERDLTLIVVSHRVEVVGPLADQALFVDRRRGQASVGRSVWAPVPQIWDAPEVASVYPVALELQRSGGSGGA